MAGHGNNRKGKKPRNIGACGMSKHRKSGVSPRNRFSTMLMCIVVNKSNDRLLAIKASRRPAMFSTITELMRSARG